MCWEYLTSPIFLDINILHLEICHVRHKNRYLTFSWSYKINRLCEMVLVYPIGDHTSLYSKPWLPGIDYGEMAGGQDNITSVTRILNGLNSYLHDFS